MNRYVSDRFCASQCLLVVLAALGTVFFVGGAEAATVHVDISNISGTENGTSQATAFNTIQEGVDAASSGDTVLVAPGTYTENVVIPIDINLLSSDINSPENYIIDGSDQGAVITYDPGQGAQDAGYELAGFTIQNGQRFSGGGISGDLSRGPNLEKG